MNYSPFICQLARFYGRMLTLSIFAFHLACISALAQTESRSPPDASTPAMRESQKPLSRELREFREEMSRIPLPGTGCFTAQYPKKEWKNVECVPGPKLPYPLSKGTPTNGVGSGRGYFAQLPSGNVTSAVGSFDNVAGVT